MTEHEENQLLMARAWMRAKGIAICGEEHLRARRLPDFREVPRYDMHPLHRAQQDGFPND